MCGIAGYIQRQGVHEDPLDRMLQRLAHRGPDGHGSWRGHFRDWSVSLGHRRLSILDIQGGAQPMRSASGGIVITYNGEVFNFPDLRTRLQCLGRRFSTRSDTEVVLHHFAQFSTAGLAQLNGMFAFAIWDQKTGSLTLARDRIGIKPLYYAALRDGGLAFASELLALAEHPGVHREIDAEGLASYFFADYVHPPGTLLRGVQKLRPGHFLVWRDGHLSNQQAYWGLTERTMQACNARRPDQLARELAHRLRDSVRAQLVSDVPIGVFLSGGIDSSFVAALAQRELGRPIQTFSIGFEDPEFDESPFARQVARHIGSAHVERTLCEANLLDTLDASLDGLDEPIADPSILPTYLVSQLAARNVKVVLGGDGGDELWGGYPTYIAHRHAAWYALLPRLARDSAIGPLLTHLRIKDGYQSLEWKLKRFALRWDDDPLVRHLRWMSNTDDRELATIIPASIGLPGNLKRFAAAATQGDFLNSLLALDLQTYLPGSVLAKVDRMSMTHGLEVRPPMLDNNLVNFAFSIPSTLKVRRESKVLLKMAARPFLPRQLIHRRKKGFAIPLARWLRGPLLQRLHRVIATSPLWETGLLDRVTFVQWLDQHLSRKLDRSKPLWALLVLDHWWRRMSCPATVAQ